MNAAKNKVATGEKTQQELLLDIIHRLKHLEKSQQEIKAHLWRTKGERITKEDGRDSARCEGVIMVWSSSSTSSKFMPGGVGRSI